MHVIFHSVEQSLDFLRNNDEEVCVGAEIGVGLSALTGLGSWEKSGFYEIFSGPAEAMKRNALHLQENNVKFIVPEGLGSRLPFHCANMFVQHKDEILKDFAFLKANAPSTKWFDFAWRSCLTFSAGSALLWEELWKELKIGVHFGTTPLQIPL